MARGAVGGERPFLLPHVVGEPGQLAEGAGMGTFLAGSFVGFQSQHREGGAGGLEDPPQKGNLVIGSCSSLCLQTLPCSQRDPVLHEENADSPKEGGGN